MRYSRALGTVVLFAGFATAIYTNGSIIAPCDSQLYCYGQLLQDIQLARPFADSKSFVDLPTLRPLNEVLEAGAQLARPLQNNSALQDFISENFGLLGGELQEVDTATLTTEPEFLDRVTDTITREFVEKVVDIWPDLTREYNGTTACEGCVNSFLPLERSFVIAGGRFREPYYWDSFWVIEGLLRTGGSFTQIALNIIENFLDFVERYGFVPNGARVYYLNRSQPPVLTQMVKAYVEYTNDTSILERAVPILIKEYEFWTVNRTVEIQAYGKTYHLNNYNVSNTQPRPESYREDYVTANNASYFNTRTGEIFPAARNLSEAERATLYSNLASGAESGWDYTSRWIANLDDELSGRGFPLRSLNTVNTIPVDLNSILYGNEIALAEFLETQGNHSAASQWRSRAQDRSQAMYDLLFNQRYFSYFDYNLTSGTQNLWQPIDNTTTAVQQPSDAPEGFALAFSVAQYYPWWLGAVPAAIAQNPSLVRLAFNRIADTLSVNEGGIAATNLRTSEQWDEPNVWPPLQYILLKGLLSAPPTSGTQNADYIFLQDTALELAKRYLASTYCTWRQTGGSSASNPRSATAGEGDGIIFEKYSEDALDTAGGGGEYEVVEGFGWTNGVLIWIADVFGEKLVEPECPTGGQRKRSVKGEMEGRSAVLLHGSDARMLKKFK